MINNNNFMDHLYQNSGKFAFFFHLNFLSICDIDRSQLFSNGKSFFIFTKKEWKKCAYLSHLPISVMHENRIDEK